MVIVVILVIILIAIALYPTNNTPDPVFTAAAQPILDAVAAQQAQQALQQPTQDNTPPPPAPVVQPQYDMNFVPVGMQRVPNMSIDWTGLQIAYPYGGTGQDDIVTAAAKCVADTNCKFGLSNIGMGVGGFFNTLPDNKQWSRSDGVATDYIASRLSSTPAIGTYTPQIQASAPQVQAATAAAQQQVVAAAQQQVAQIQATATQMNNAVQTVAQKIARWASGDFTGVSNDTDVQTAYQAYIAAHPGEITGLLGAGRLMLRIQSALPK